MKNEKFISIVAQGISLDIIQPKGRHYFQACVNARMTGNEMLIEVMMLIVKHSGTGECVSKEFLEELDMEHLIKIVEIVQRAMTPIN